MCNNACNCESISFNRMLCDIRFMTYYFALGQKRVSIEFTWKTVFYGSTRAEQ